MANYIDNKALFQKFLDWRPQMLEDKKNGIDQPRPPDSIIEDAYLIATKYSQQKKWYNIDEAIMDEAIPLAVEFCIKYLHNFDPEKTKNPFAYITTLANNAILQSYSKDQKEKVGRMHYLTRELASSTYIRSDGEIDLIAQGEFSQNYIKHMEQAEKDYEADQ